jgi:hypothetical protein
MRTPFMDKLCPHIFGKETSPNNSRDYLISNMTFMKIVQSFWYTVLQGTMMQFSHLFDAPLLTPLASILVGNYLFQGRFKSHFCYCLLQNYYTSKKW